MADISEIFVSVPKYVENLQLPDPGLLAYYRDLEQRTFWITDEITDEVLDIAKHIVDFNRADVGIPVDQRKPIKICIFSQGGLLDATLSLAAVCELSVTPIHTYNMGLAMSAGLLVLLAGHKRYCLPGSRVMIHSGSGGVGGSYEQVEAATKDYKRVIEYMREYIVRRTNITPQILGRKKKEDWYIYVDEQLKLGVVDEVLNDIGNLL